MKYVKIIIPIFIVILVVVLIRRNSINKDLPVYFYKNKGYISLSKDETFMVQLLILGSKNAKLLKDINSASKIKSVSFDDKNISVDMYDVFQDKYTFFEEISTDMQLYHLNVTISVPNNFNGDKISLNNITINTTDQTYSYDLGDIEIQVIDKKDQEIDNILSTREGPGIGFGFGFIDYSILYNNISNGEVIIEKVSIGDFCKFTPTLKINNDFTMELKNKTENINDTLKPNQDLKITISNNNVNGYDTIFFAPTFDVRFNNKSMKLYTPCFISFNYTSFGDVNNFYKQLVVKNNQK